MKRRFQAVLKYQRLLALGLIIVTAAVCAALVLPVYLQKDATIQENAAAACSAAEDDLHCYSTYYARLTYSQPADDVFKQMKTAYEQDSLVQTQCHQLTHIVGRTAVKRYGSLAAAYQQGDSFCWSGFYHGATEQAIGDIGGDKIKAQLNELCADIATKNRYSFDHYNCVHGLGHGLMAIDSYELFNALKTCDTLTDSWERTSCYGGVYMENVMVAVRENGYSKYLKKDDLLYPCNAVDAKYKDQCYLMQSSYMLQNNGYNFAETFKLCGRADTAYRNTCYQSIGRDASGSTTSDVTRTKANCDTTADDNAKRHCMIGAAKDFVSYFHNDDEALRLCATFGGTMQADCQETVRSYHSSL